MNNKIDYNNLKDIVVSSGDEYDFNNLDDSLAFLNNIKKGKILLDEAINQQRNFYNYLNMKRIGNKMITRKRF